MKNLYFKKWTLLFFVIIPSLCFSQLPINEGFENATFPPSGWTRWNAPTSSTWTRWSVSSMYAHSGNGSGWSYIVEAVDENKILFSPQINLPIGTKISVKCWVNRNTTLASTPVHSFKIVTSSSLNESGVTNTLSEKTSWTNDTWEQITANFTTTSSPFYIGFWSKMDPLPMGEVHLFLDDISVEEANCNIPTVAYTTFNSATQFTLNIYDEFPATSTGYQYSVTSSGGLPTTWIDTPNRNNNVVTGVTMDGSYTIHVRKKCGEFLSDYSSTNYQHIPPCYTPQLSYNSSYSSAEIYYSVPNSWTSQAQYELSLFADFSVLTSSGTVSISQTTSTLNLTGLTQGVLYYFRMRSVCPATTCTTPCEWNSTSFLTQMCNAPYFAKMTYNSDTEQTFKWSTVPGAAGYRWRIKNAGGAIVTTSVAFTPDYSNTYPLVSGNTYNFSVSTQCSLGDGSASIGFDFVPQSLPSTTLPYSIDFNNYPENSLPSGWKLLDDEMNDGWFLKEIPIPGLGGIKGLVWGQDHSNSDFVLSPDFNFEPGNYELKITYSSAQYNPSSKFRIFLTENTNTSVINTETPIYEKIGEDVTDGFFRLTTIGIPFSVTTSGLKHFAFNGIDGVSNINISKLTIQLQPSPTSMSVAASGNDDVCYTYTAHNVQGNNWFNIYDNNGNILASVNPQDVNLGNVTLNISDRSSVESYLNLSGVRRDVLPRRFGFSSQNYAHSVNFPRPILIRLYFLEEEIQALRDISGISGLTPAQVTLTHFSTPTVDCDIINNLGVGTASVLSPSATFITAGGNHSIQFSVPHFSEFAIHTPSLSPLTSSTTTSLSELGSKDGIIIKNSPSNKFTLESSKKIDKVSVYDIRGQLILETSTNEINLSNKTAGIYVFEIQMSGEKYIHRVILK